MKDPDLLEPAVVTDKDKEIYVDNLERSLRTLSEILETSDNSDSFLVDFALRIAQTVHLYKYNQNKENHSENTGVYKNLEIDRRFGFPGLETIVLFSSKAASAEREIKRLDKKEVTAKKAVDVLLNWDPSENGRSELQNLSDIIREINFNNSLLERNYADLPEGVSSKTSIIELVEETDQVESFKLFYAGWDIGRGFFCAYSILLEDDKEKYLKIGPDKPGHVFKSSDSGKWRYGDEIRSLLASSFGLHPQHYFNALNQLEGIHPKQISYLGFDHFESKYSPKNFKEVIERHPDAGILTATVIFLSGDEVIGSGKSRQTKVDLDKDSDAALHVICSEETKSEVIEFYKHNKHIDFTITPY